MYDAGCKKEDRRSLGQYSKRQTDSSPILWEWWDRLTGSLLRSAATILVTSSAEIGDRPQNRGTPSGCSGWVSSSFDRSRTLKRQNTEIFQGGVLLNRSRRSWWTVTLLIGRDRTKKKEILRSSSSFRTGLASISSETVDRFDFCARAEVAIYFFTKRAARSSSDRSSSAKDCASLSRAMQSRKTKKKSRAEEEIARATQIFDTI